MSTTVFDFSRALCIGAHPNRYETMHPAVLRNYELAKAFADPIKYIWDNGVGELVTKSAQGSTCDALQALRTAFVTTLASCPVRV